MPYYKAITSRITRRPAGPFTPIFPQDIARKPYPPNNQLLFRYMDLLKFEKMLLEGYYLRRSNKHEDQTEGTLSKEGIHGTSLSEQAFLSAYPIHKNPYNTERDYQEASRQCIYTSSWAIDTKENERLWWEYTDSPNSLVLVTSAKALLKVFKPHIPPVECYPVSYVNENTPRVLLDVTSLHFYKDRKKYGHEKELRICRALLSDESTSDNPDDDGYIIKIDNKRLIHRVITHPNIDKGAFHTVIHLVKKHCPRATVNVSKLILPTATSYEKRRKARELLNTL